MDANTRQSLGGTPGHGNGARPVRVLIVAPAPVDDMRIGGIANFIRGFIRHMPEDFNVEIVGVDVADAPAVVDWRTITLAGRQVRFLPVTHSRSARRSGRVPLKARIVGGMLRNRDRIPTSGRIAQLHAPAMDLGLIGRHVPTIRVVHNDPADLAASRGESAWRRIGWGLRAAERLAFSRASRVYFVNRATLDRYRGGAADADGRLRYLPNGIDTDVFRPLEPPAREVARAQLAKELQLSPERRWLLYAGRLDQQKDPLLLLRAFAVHAADQPLATDLLIVGDGRLRRASEALALDLGVAEHVHFLGAWPRERLAQLMPAADAFVLASEFEAAPFVILEALASGLPVAATAVGEVPAMVRHGETGWIATERNPEALARAIAWVLGQPRTEIAARAATSMAPYQLANVLAPLYEDHRLLARGAS